MSIIKNGPMKGTSGKVDDLQLVYKTKRDGTTYAAKLPQKPEVPLRTKGMMDARLQMASVGNCYEPFRGQLNYTYEETRVGQTMRRDFIGLNVKQKLGCCLTKEQRKAGYQVLGNFQVSCGPDTIPTIQVAEKDGKFVTNIGLGDLRIDRNTTQAQFAAAVAANNGDEFCVTTDESLVANGGFGTPKPVYDSITLLFARQLISLKGAKPTIYVESFQIPLLALDSAKSRKLDELFDVSLLSVTDVVNGDATRHCLSIAKGGGIVLFTVIHSRRKGNGVTLCSNQWLVGRNPLRDSYLTAEARAKAYLSYGGVNRFDNADPLNNPPARSNKPTVPDISMLMPDADTKPDQGTDLGSKPDEGTAGDGGNSGNPDPTPGEGQQPEEGGAGQQPGQGGEGENGGGTSAEGKVQVTVTGSASNGVEYIGSGLYTPGTQVQIQARVTDPNSNLVFDRWNDGNSQNPRTITVPDHNETYTAFFSLSVR